MTPELNHYVAHLRNMYLIAEKVPPTAWQRATENLDAMTSDISDVSVFYINLESHSDRRQHIESELDGLALPYLRVPAIKEHYGYLGCLKSHVKTLRIAKKAGCLWTAVFEDDFAFQCSFEEAKSRIQFLLDNSPLAPVWIGDWVVNGPAPLEHTIYSNVKQANGACNNTSCYFVRRDYIDVLLGTWESSLNKLVTELKHRVEQKRTNMIPNHGPLWWYNPDVTWAPLQIRDHWLLFSPQLGAQQKNKFQSSLEPSIVSFEETGYLDVPVDEITTDIT